MNLHKPGGAARGRIKTFFINCCAIEAIYFAAFAILTYQTGFLDKIGYSSSRIGLITSIGLIIATLALPLWGLVSDRLGSAKKIFALCLLGLTVVYLLLSLLGSTRLGSGLLPVTLLIVAGFVFRQPTNALMDAWIIGETAPHGIEYGLIRRWGSIGYAVCSFILSYLVGNLIGMESVFYLLPVWVLPLLALVYFSGRGRAPTEQRAAGTGERPSLAEAFKLLRLFPLTMYLIYSFGCNIYLAVTTVYFIYILRYAGCNENLIGAFVGFRALMEVISMSLAPRLRKKMPLAAILLVSGLLFGAEQLLYRFASGALILLVIMALSGLAGGIFYSMGPQYVYRIVPEQMKSTAQTLSAVTMSCVAILGSFIGGAVIESYGVEALTTACGLIIFALTALFAASLFCRKRGQSGAKTENRRA